MPVRPAPYPLHAGQSKNLNLKLIGDNWREVEARHVIINSMDHDQSRPVATSPDMTRYVTRLESENDFLRGQVAVKDTQIAALTDHAKQTTTTLGALQRLIAPLIASPDPYRAASQEGESPRSELPQN